MKPPPDPHYRHRFPAEIISHTIWLYHVFSLSLRDLELILAERGIVVSYETVRRWCMKFGARRLPHTSKRRWLLATRWQRERTSMQARASPAKHLEETT